jgi:hypothetical protein
MSQFARVSHVRTRVNSAKARTSQCSGAEPLEERRLLSVISGNVSHDANDNGVKDTGEAGLSGWTVYDDMNWNGTKDATEPSSVTDASGNFSFTSSSSSGSSFNIKVVQQSSWRLSYPTSGSYVFVRDGTNHTGLLFGETHQALITGQVFHDMNYNGTKDTGESFYNSRRVYLDLDFDGIRGATEPTTLTSGAGTYTFRNLTPATTYRVAMDDAGWGMSAPQAEYYDQYVDTADAVTLPLIGEYRTLIEPQNLTAAHNATTPTTIDLGWQLSTGEELGVRIEESVNGGAYTQVADLTGAVTSTSLTGRNVNSTYNYRVRSYDADGNSYYSNVANPDAPGPVTDLASNSNSTSVTLTWTAPASGADSYTIYRSTSPDVLGSTLATGVTGTSYTDNTTASGVTYYYSVAAVRNRPNSLTAAATPQMNVAGAEDAPGYITYSIGYRFTHFFLVHQPQLFVTQTLTGPTIGIHPVAPTGYHLTGWETGSIEYVHNFRSIAMRATHANEDSNLQWQNLSYDTDPNNWYNVSSAGDGRSYAHATYFVLRAYLSGFYGNPPPGIGLSDPNGTGPDDIDLDGDPSSDSIRLRSVAHGCVGGDVDNPNPLLIVNGTVSGRYSVTYEIAPNSPAAPNPTALQRVTAKRAERANLWLNSAEGLPL